jgi:hypothetical protein
MEQAPQERVAEAVALRGSSTNARKSEWRSVWRTTPNASKMLNCARRASSRSSSPLSTTKVLEGGTSRLSSAAAYLLHIRSVPPDPPLRPRASV